MRPYHSVRVSRFLAVVGFVGLTACGGSGGGGGSQNPPVLNLAGYWRANTIFRSQLQHVPLREFDSVGKQNFWNHDYHRFSLRRVRNAERHHQRFERDYVVGGGASKCFPQRDRISRRQFDYRYVSSSRVRLHKRGFRNFQRGEEHSNFRERFLLTVVHSGDPDFKVLRVRCRSWGVRFIGHVVG